MSRKMIGLLFATALTATACASTPRAVTVRRVACQAADAACEVIQRVCDEGSGGEEVEE